MSTVITMDNLSARDLSLGEATLSFVDTICSLHIEVLVKGILSTVLLLVEYRR